MSYFCDYDMPSFYQCIDIKNSKKAHICCECNNTIEKDSPYVRISGKWDNRIEAYKQHPECAEACRAVRDMQDGECIPFGFYLEWLGESYPRERKNFSKRVRRSIARLCLNHKNIRSRIKEWIKEEDV